ncbi:MAG TPA: hypothetical protein VF185_00030 [Patescibacteria group bacterium]
MSAENSSIIIQVGPSVNIKSIVEDKIGRLIIAREAEMVLNYLLEKEIIPHNQKYSVSFLNEDCGNTSYPYIDINGVYYAVYFLNRC